MARISIFRTR